jgi:hypothetical protein
MRRKNILTALIISLSIMSLALTKSCRYEQGINSKSGHLPDDSLLTLVQYQTFRYFWDGAEPESGMARERIHMDGAYPEDDMNIVTSGGTGFGIMAIITGIERAFITREEGFRRIEKIVNNLEKAERFHGAWSHWIDGRTGRVKPFSKMDNGADIVETAYLVQGLLCARQYFKEGHEAEKQLAMRIDKLWTEVEWDWFTKGGEAVLYWHWSPDYGWEMNHKVQGYNECLILYVLAASSPTFAVDPAAYHLGWARAGGINTSAGAYGYPLRLRHNGAEEFGGPLFWSHYSYLGLDPRNLWDRYADYWKENTNHSLINWKWCVENKGGYKGYSENCWGLTASYSVEFYSAHAPGEGKDLGVISPTAAISSIPYTPEQSLNAIRHFYYELGDRIFGEYGFYDAFSESAEWFPEKYLAIDQGPEIIMIENFRTGLFWNLFMSCPEIEAGLSSLGFEAW